MTNIITTVLTGDRLYGLIAIFSGFLFFLFRTNFIKQTKAFNRLFGASNDNNGSFVESYSIFFPLLLIVVGIILVGGWGHLHH